MELKECYYTLGSPTEPEGITINKVFLDENGVMKTGFGFVDADGKITGYKFNEVTEENYNKLKKLIESETSKTGLAGGLVTEDVYNEINEDGFIEKYSSSMSGDTSVTFAYIDFTKTANESFAMAIELANEN